jgi:hypothetical protein
MEQKPRFQHTKGRRREQRTKLLNLFQVFPYFIPGIYNSDKTFHLSSFSNRANGVKLGRNLSKSKLVSEELTSMWAQKSLQSQATTTFLGLIKSCSEM